MTTLTTAPTEIFESARAWLRRCADAELARLAAIGGTWTPEQVARCLGARRMANLVTYWSDDAAAAPASLIECAEVLATVMADLATRSPEEWAA